MQVLAFHVVVLFSNTSDRDEKYIGEVKGKATPFLNSERMTRREVRILKSFCRFKMSLSMHRGP